MKAVRNENNGGRGKWAAADKILGRMLALAGNRLSEREKENSETLGRYRLIVLTCSLSVQKWPGRYEIPRAAESPPRRRSLYWLVNATSFHRPGLHLLKWKTSQPAFFLPSNQTKMYRPESSADPAHLDVPVPGLRSGRQFTQIWIRSRDLNEFN